MTTLQAAPLLTEDQRRRRAQRLLVRFNRVTRRGKQARNGSRDAFTDMLLLLPALAEALADLHEDDLLPDLMRTQPIASMDDSRANGFRLAFGKERRDDNDVQGEQHGTEG